MTGDPTRRVLVIDDNLVDREAVRRLIDDEADVLEAGTAEEGLEIALRERPDLVLLDFRLPGRDGLDLLPDLTEHDIPVIMLTGQGDEKLAAAAMKAGASDYMVKSRLDRDSLRGAISRTLHEAELRRDLEVAVEAARRAEARYRALFRSRVAGLFVMGPDGSVLECNAALARTLRYEGPVEAVEDGLRPLRSTDLFQTETIDALEKHQEMPFLEAELEAADGSFVAVIATVIGEFDDEDELVAVHGYVVDVTELRLAQRERDLLAAAVKQADEAIFITDPDGVITMVNDAFQEITGYPAEEAVGSTPKLFSSGQHDASVYRELWETITGGETWRGRLVNRRKNGELFHVDETISPVLDESGDIVRFMAFQKDVTREVELERQLEAAMRLEAVGQLSGGIAHDFNNLLTVVLGSAEYALARLEEGGKPEEALTEIQQAAMSGRELTSQLLAFSRRQVLSPQLLDVEAEIRDVEPILERALGDDVELVVELAGDVGTVRADPSQLQSVLVNLAVNARDAMPGGGQLRVATGREEIEEDRVDAGLTDVARGSYVKLSVADTGVGMSEDVQARVFEPFFSTKETGDGHGLGLAMVYGTVKQSGGTIHLDSEPGVGTTVTILLPAVDEEDEGLEEDGETVHVDGTADEGGPPEPGTDRTGPDDETQKERPASQARILVVEDNRHVRRSVQRTLEREDCTVVVAENAEAALDFLDGDDGSLDLLVTDVVMPGRSGVELAEEFVERAPGVPILFVSGYSEDIAKEGRAPATASAFLKKPFTREELVEAVREVLGRA